jgi:hypothetical protein
MLPKALFQRGRRSFVARGIFARIATKAGAPVTYLERGYSAELATVLASYLNTWAGKILSVVVLNVAVRTEQLKTFGVRADLGNRSTSALTPFILFGRVLVVKLQRSYAAVISTYLATTAKGRNKFLTVTLWLTHMLPPIHHYSAEMRKTQAHDVLTNAA